MLSYRYLFAVLLIGTVANSAPITLDPQVLEHQFVELIINGHKRPLDPQMHQGCTKNSRTVGEFYAQIMNEYLYGAGTDKKITVSCGHYNEAKPTFKPPKKNYIPVECAIELDWKNGSAQEKMAFAARIAPDGKSLERKYMACQGAK